MLPEWIIFLQFVLSVSCAISTKGVVSLKQRGLNNYRYQHICTGSILSKDWVLTAAHCYSDKYGNDRNRMAVDVGAIDVSGDDGTRYPVDDFYMHPNHTENSQIYRHDICLIKLLKPIVFEDQVRPITIGRIPNQKKVKIVGGGWGRVSQYGDLNKKLRFFLFNTMDYLECQRMHAPRHNIVDKVNQICGYKGPGVSLCFGDSGGPLFEYNTGRLVGIFSTIEDCSGEYPMLFVNVANYLDWINDLTWLDIHI